jgi:aryl-alcohol dehydrogenase-like predicted oxidoreductase
LPRFTGDNAGHNRGVAEALSAFGRERGMTPGQLAVAWVRAKTPRYVTLVGAKTRTQLADALAQKPLTPADVTALEALVPSNAIAGTRYGADQMRHLDSER